MNTDFAKVYSSTMRVKGTCQCGHELTTMLNSENFGHTDTRRLGCTDPRAVSVWIVSLDGTRPNPGETKADHLTYEEKVALANTPFANGNGKCGGCGQKLATELDFAAHFTIKDRRYLNLGDCPVEQALRPVGNI
jgi:hypothetical protein